jgi:hypothetical protein
MTVVNEHRSQQHCEDHVRRSSDLYKVIYFRNKREWHTNLRYCAKSDARTDVSARSGQIELRLNPPTDPNPNHVDHLLASVSELFEHVLQDVQDSDVVGIAISNEINQTVKPKGISFRRRFQISGNVIWSFFEKVSQSNSRFNALNNLTIEVNSVRMPVGFGYVKLKVDRFRQWLI